MQFDQIKEYLLFSRKERNAVLVLFVLILLFFTVPRLLPAPARLNDDAAVLTAARKIGWKDSTIYIPKPRQEYYSRNNGGNRYYTGYRKSNRENYYPQFNNQRRPEYTKPVVRDVLINTADSSDLIPLPGIGGVLAGRIIRFRDRLGGFCTVEQVGETYGLPDSTFRLIKEKLRLGDSSLKVININTAGIDSLRQHPYIRWALAKVIVEYRNRHGDYGEVYDLLKINVVTPEIYARISPYLTTGIKKYY